MTRMEKLDRKDFMWDTSLEGTREITGGRGGMLVEEMLRKIASHIELWRFGII